MPEGTEGEDGTLAVCVLTAVVVLLIYFYLMALEILF